MMFKFAKILPLWAVIAVIPNAKAQQSALSNEQMQASMCILANQGVYLSASERQAGTSKAKAKAVIKKELDTLNQQFTNQTFTKAIGTVWYRALDDIYKMPIQNTAQQKQDFVSDITQQAFLSCMDNVSVG